MTTTNWKTAYRSFYYEHAPEPEEIALDPSRTALLVIDIQNAYMQVPSDRLEAERWQPFLDRMQRIVIPNTQKLITECRARSVEVLFARIACQTADGRDRSLSTQAWF